MNRYSFIGNLGKDAELRTLDSGDHAISFNVAITEKWKNAQGEPQEKTYWVNCTKWVKAGGSTKLKEYLLRGTRVLIEGTPTARAYMTKEEAPAASLEVKVQELLLIGGKPAESGPAVQTPQPGGYAATYIATVGKSATPGYTADTLDQAQQFAGNWQAPHPDDLPF